MLQLKDFMPVNFLKKEKYTGSCKGKFLKNFCLINKNLIFC